MRPRLSLETLESRLAPAAVGSLSFDGQSLVVNLAPVAVVNPGAPPNTTGSVALTPATSNSITGFTATIGNLTAGNLSDSYYLPNAAQGATLNVALVGLGTMTLSVRDQYGNILAQQTGQGVLGLTVTNLPTSGGVSVVVISDSSTPYFLTTSLTFPSSIPTTPPTTPSTSTPLYNPALAFPLLDPYGVADTESSLPSIPIDTIDPSWVPYGQFGLYDPIGTPINPWMPPPGFYTPSGLPLNTTPTNPTSP